MEKYINIVNTIAFPDFFYFDLCVWVNWEDMADLEKRQHKDAFLTKGYLKTLSYKEAWRFSWEKADINDRAKVYDLPNWNAKLFYEISGIDLRRISKKRVLNGYNPYI